jgi:hypothetical protein
MPSLERQHVRAVITVGIGRHRVRPRSFRCPLARKTTGIQPKAAPRNSLLPFSEVKADLTGGGGISLSGYFKPEDFVLTHGDGLDMHCRVRLFSFLPAGVNNRRVPLLRRRRPR